MINIFLCSLYYIGVILYFAPYGKEIFLTELFCFCIIMFLLLPIALIFGFMWSRKNEDNPLFFLIDFPNDIIKDWKNKHFLENIIAIFFCITFIVIICLGAIVQPIYLVNKIIIKLKNEFSPLLDMPDLPITDIIFITFLFIFPIIFYLTSNKKA